MIRLATTTLQLGLSLGLGLGLGLLACSRPQVEPDAPTPATGEPAVPEPATPQPLVPVVAPPRLETFAGRGEVRIADRSESPVFQVELARTAAERSQGLMYRRELADDRGMLFFMPYDHDWGFYMRNTLVSLDMIFVGADWTVVGVAAAVPPLTEETRSVGRPSRYVLELGARQAARHGIGPGTRLQFQALPDAPAGAPTTARGAP